MSSPDTTTPAVPDTIVLIHGFWVTPRSWEGWVRRYTEQGFRVLAPAYPGFEVEVEALRADPTPIARLSVKAVVEHLTTVIEGLERPPILMGHSAGGAFVQILLDRGLGASGVAISSAPTQGVPVVPFSQVRATFPILRNPANRHRAVGFTLPQWRYAFANTFTPAGVRETYERYAVPASRDVLLATALAGRRRSPGPTWVDYSNGDRAPLLFVSGGPDRVMPPSVQRANAARYRSSAVTDHIEFPDMAHLLPAQDGWEEVADIALEWALTHSRPAPTRTTAGQE
jgi:pimeloyl-ACP methyl ester carboxylesterase